MSITTIVPKLAVGFAIFIITQLRPAELSLVTRMSSLQRHLLGPANFVFDANVTKGNDSLLYASCDDSNYPQEITCSLTIESFTKTPDYSRLNNTCSLSLKPEDGLILSRRHIPLESFSESKAIVTWALSFSDQLLSRYLRVSIVDMISCKIKTLDFDLGDQKPPLEGNVAIYGNSFDIFVSDTKLCGSQKLDRCRVSYDEFGNQIGDPKAFATSLSIARILPATPSSGFFVGGPSDANSAYKVEYLDKSGSRTFETNLKGLRGSPNAFSTAHNLLGLCWLTVMDIDKCGLIDPMSNSTISYTLYLPRDSTVVAMLNLQNGGFLLLTWKRNCAADDAECRSFEILRVHQDGQQGERAELPGIRIKCDVLRAAIADVDQDYCFYLVCSHNEYEKSRKFRSSLKYSTACLAKRDLDEQEQPLMLLSDT